MLVLAERSVSAFFAVGVFIAGVLLSALIGPAARERGYASTLFVAAYAFRGVWGLALEYILVQNYGNLWCCEATHRPTSAKVQSQAVIEPAPGTYRE